MRDSAGDIAMTLELTPLAAGVIAGVLRSGFDKAGVTIPQELTDGLSVLDAINKAGVSIKSAGLGTPFADNQVIDMLTAAVTGSGGVLAIAIWYNPGKGYLACLLDKDMTQIPGTTTWDYHPTVAGAIKQVALAAEGYMQQQRDKRGPLPQPRKRRNPDAPA